LDRHSCLTERTQRSANALDSGSWPATELFLRRRGWNIASHVREINSGAVRSPGENTGGRATAGDRSGAAMAVGLLGPLRYGFAGDTSGTGASRGWFRIADRGAGSDHTPAGRAMAGLLAIFAEFAREILRERTRAGLAHARGRGKRLGPPATAARHADEVHKLHRAGISKSEIARRLDLWRTSVRRIIGEQKRS
jgi:hypothetical protein